MLLVFRHYTEKEWFWQDFTRNMYFPKAAVMNIVIRIPGLPCLKSSQGGWHGYMKTWHFKKYRFVKSTVYQQKQLQNSSGIDALIYSSVHAPNLGNAISFSLLNAQSRPPVTEKVDFCLCVLTRNVAQPHLPWKLYPGSRNRKGSQNAGLGRATSGVSMMFPHSWPLPVAKHTQEALHSFGVNGFSQFCPHLGMGWVNKLSV